MTKEQFIYLILTTANSDDVPGRKKGSLHRGDIERHCELAYSDICREVYNNAMYYRDYGQLDAMTKYYANVAVSVDPQTKERYSVLPIQPMNLPNNAGIRMVMTRDDQKKTVYYRPNNNIGAMEAMDVYLDNDMATYYVQGKRIYFNRFEGDSIDMKLVPTFSSYSEMDEVPLITGYEGRAFDLVMQRIRAMGDQKDTTNQSEQ